jgi:hypothetical protein
MVSIAEDGSGCKNVPVEEPFFLLPSSLRATTARTKLSKDTTVRMSVNQPLQTAYVRRIFKRQQIRIPSPRRSVSRWTA